MNCVAPSCEANLTNGYVYCHTHTQHLEEQLAEVDGVWEDIMITLSRQDVGTPSVGGGTSTGSKPPINLGALEPTEQLTAVLTGWANTLGGRRGTTVPTISSWLLTNIDRVRRQDWAHELHTELREALNQCRRSVDRHEQRVFAGICKTQHCGTAVYVKQGNPIARCRTCTAEWDVTNWRLGALALAGIHSGTVTELSRMLSDPTTMELLSPIKINEWVYEKRLTPTGERDGRKTYNVADVLNLWEEYKAKRATRRQQSLS